MDVRVGLVVLLFFAFAWMSDARNCATSEDAGYEFDHRRMDLCPLCEQSVDAVLSFLTDDKIQDAVVKALDDTCAHIQNFEDQCKSLVEGFAETFFSEFSSLQPKGLCTKVGLCKKPPPPVVSSLPTKQNKCDACRQATNEVLNMLNDPDNELGIIERLLRACNAVGNKYKTKCKVMVFEYGPVLIPNAGIFFEKVDFCTTFHACARQQQVEKERAQFAGMIEMVTSSD